MEEQRFKPAVLLFQVRDPLRAARIGSYLQRRSIRLIEVGEEDLHRSIGELLGIPGTERRQSRCCEQVMEEEMLVMFAFQGTMMKDFLQFFRDEGLTPVALKAVATPTNIFWSAQELYAELSKEREYFRSRETKR